MNKPTVDLCAVYGPNMTFALALGPADEFQFISSGNTEPLFPPLEIGRWQGKDLPGVERLVAAISACTEPDNAPFRSGSAYCYVRHGLGEQEVKRRYSLYQPPPAWAPVQADVLAQAFGPWLDSRVHTLGAEARWLRPEIAASDSAMVAIDFANTGAQEVSFTSPLRAEAWNVSLVPHGMTAQQLERYPYELDEDEYSLLSPMATTSGTQLLDQGKTLSVMLTIKRELDPGGYDVRLSYSSRPKVRDLSHAGGRLTFELAPLKVRGKP